MVDFLVNVTDNYQVNLVTIAILDPEGLLVGNFTMALVAGNYTYSTSFDKLGTHTFTIWASDTSGNYASAAGQFIVEDTTSPVLGTPSASPSPQEVYQTIDFSVSVTDNYQVAAVTIAIVDPDGVSVGNFTMTLAAGNYTYSTSFDKLGTHAFTIWAGDTSGNYASVGGQFVIQDTTAPIAIATGGGTYEIGEEVVFDASRSTDNTEIANVSWTFLYQGSEVVLYGSTVSFTFETTGEYTVYLLLVDIVGLTASEVLIVLIVDTTPPSSPSIESALPFGDGCLVVTWATVDDRDLAGYRLSRWNASSNAFEEVAELSAEVSSYRDCGLEPDKVYTYRLTAFDGAGNESPHSFMVNGRTEGTREEAFNLIPYLVSIGALVILVSVLAFLAIRPRRPPGQMSQREATGYRPRR
ncbi:MAG: PKD domain-containing protein [Anaerolineae bacterium]|nr:PKD domain-containing protein [Anaerolineae bacterium]